MRAQSTPFQLVTADSAALESRRAAMLEAALDCIITMDGAGRVVDFNAAAERTFGYDRTEVRGRPLSELIIPPQHREAHDAAFRRHLLSGQSKILGRRLELPALRRDGSEIPVELTVTRSDLDGEPLFIGFLRDLTGIHNAQAALREAEARFRRLVEQVPTVTYICDNDEKQSIRYISPQIERWTGYQPDRWVADPDFWLSVVHPDDRERVAAEVERCTVEDIPFDCEFRVIAADGSTVVVWDQETIIRDDHGGKLFSQGVLVDVTELRTTKAALETTEAQLAHYAVHDRLTGLANRSRLEEALRAAVERAEGAGTAVALLNLDLDDFKTVNDSLGHATGDELLCALGRRLDERVDGAHLLARHGGDEFMLLIEDVPGDGRAAAEAVARELLDELERPFSVGHGELQVSGSVGISLFPGDARDADDLLMHADAAMYQAKDAGRGGLAVYRADFDRAHRRLELTSRLRAALAGDELELHFQPVFELGTRRPAGVEALLRWNDPERGMVSPAEFIPLAEETGLIQPIGEWVLNAVCRQARVWQDLGLDVEVAFNVSPQELTRPGFGRRLGERMEAHGVQPGRLAMEIIESALADPETVSPVLEEVADLGVNVAIDDFGAGFSSLTRLRHLTVHALKLDRTFLLGVPADLRGGAFITAMLGLARQLGLRVVAEGIETPEQLKFLQGEHCGRGQGYHLARPMPADAVTALLVEAQAVAGRGGAPS